MKNIKYEAFPKNHFRHVLDEREAYDLMVISFKEHPDMRRIFLPSDWEGYPLQKKYKEPDYYHGVPVPKDKSYWD